MNSNHLSFSRTFQNSIYFTSKSIVLFYSLDELDISLEIRSWIILSVKSLLNTSTLQSFYLLETRLKNISVDYNKSTSLFCYRDKLNTRVRRSVNSSNSDFTFVFQNFVKRVSIRIIFVFRNYCKITFIYLVNQRSSQISTMLSISSLLSNFDFFNSSQDIDLFNSSLSCSDSKIRQFNDVTSFLRNLEHCQKLYRYRRTKLLEYMLWALNDFVWEWFKKQSHFNSLSRFEMILTKAFSSQKQRELKSIAQKRAKRKARKIAKRIELKIIKKTKQTSKFQDIDIFDSALTNDTLEFELYSEIALFLQHFERCQHLYRTSDLLNLLSKCLCDFASEWFKTQSEFILLKRFNKILAKAFFFAKTSFKRVASRESNFQLCTFVAISTQMKNASNQKIIQMICKRCKKNLNFNEKLYEHIRNHEILKLVKNSFLSINAANLVCEIEKKSFVTHVSFVSLAKFQKSIFEFAIALEAVILLKRSSFSFFTLETVSKSIENTSMQCSSASSISSFRTMTFSEVSIFCSSLTNFTFEIESESTKRSTTCRHCKQTFNFKKMFRQHKRKQHAKRFVVNSHFSIDAVKSACESIEISTVNFTLSLLASLDIFNSTRSHQNLERKRFNQIIVFIQHLQQCQHLYCESELLEWVKVVLYDFVEIWFENQSNFIFLHDFNIVLTRAFFATSENLISNTKTILQIDSSKATCRHCDEIFNSKNSFRKHKSEQHSKKHVKNFRLENNAAKLLCAIEKKSIVINKLVSFELRISIATSKQKFEFAMIFEAVISLKNSHFSFVTSETVSESMKNILIQCFATSLKSSSSQTFESEHREISVQEFSNICSFLSNNTVNSRCEIVEKSTIISTAEISELISKQNVEWRSRIVYLSTRLKTSRLNFSLNTFVTISEKMKNASIQKITCAKAMCKSCKQNFDFNEKLFEHIREHEIVKRTNKNESTCETVNKSTIACSSNSQISTIFFATSRKLVTNIRTFWQFVSSRCSNFSIATFKITSKRVKRASIQQIVCARICKRCKQNFNFNNKFHEHIRKHHARKSVKNLNFRVFASESTCKIKKKSTSICSSVSFVSSILFATSTSIFESISSKCSSLSIATLNIISKSMKKLSVSFFRTSVSKRQKLYFTIDDLIRMFHEKSKSFDLCQHQKNFAFSQSDDTRSSRQLYQTRIISYFMSAINQKSSISQNSKSSKSKSLSQYMFAKFIRTAFSKNFSEKSIDLLYKLSDVFCHLKLLNSNKIAKVVFFIFILFHFFFDFISCFRNRFDHVNCNNELH